MTLKSSLNFFLLLDAAVLSLIGGAAVLFELGAEVLDVLVELIVAGADEVSLLFKVLIVVFEVFLADLAVVERGGEV